MKNIIITSGLLLGLSSVALASEGEPSESALAAVGMDKTEGCMTGPMAQFGRYIGDWTIEDMQLSADGKEWTKGPGARWNFTCLGNGTAIQDFWMPNGGGFGTNLRMYDKDNDRWNIAWTAVPTPSMTHIQAKQDAAGNIVMHYVSPKPNPARRITFFSPDEKGWDWTLDISSDGEKTWRTVYKIRATKR